MAEKTFYITTAISYPNGPPHMGHAYESLCVDALARFKKLDGYNVFFVTGTDDHGQKMFRTARDEGIAPKDFADKMTPKFKEMDARLLVSYDRFIRTSEDAHHKSVQALWRKIDAAGDIYTGTYAGWYSVRDEAFYTESDLIKDDKGEKCAPSGAPVEWVEEESYFFRLSDYQEKLLAYYKAHPDFIAPEARRNEVMRFVEGGLRDLSVSRTSFDWGIRVPGSDTHIVYVWLDALANYLTAAGYPDTKSQAYRKFWPADIHVIGKDVLRFHAVYWPAFLMSAGLPLPKRVFAHGMVLTREGEKMSKSLGNAADPFTLVDTYGADATRYFFLREVPFGADGAYSHAALETRINADLANDFGNLAQRSLTMIQRDWEGVVPPESEPTQASIALAKKTHALLDSVRAHMEAQRMDRALSDVFEVVAEANRYFASQEPWKLVKTDKAAQGAVLYAVCEVLRHVALVLLCITPNAAARLLDFLSVPAEARSFAFWGAPLAPGTKLPAPEALFPRYKS